MSQGRAPGPSSSTRTVICELTGMDVSNASGYDGTTVAAGRLLCGKARDRGARRWSSPRRQNPQVRQVMKTYAPRPSGLEVVRSAAQWRRQPIRASCARAATDAACRHLPAAELLRSPRALLPISPPRRTKRGAIAVAHVDPISLGVLEAPGCIRMRHGDRRRPERGQLSVLRRPPLRVSSRRSTTSFRRMPGRIVGENARRRG